MFYWLTELSDKISFLNVFRYITFRTGGAIVTALVFVFLFVAMARNRIWSPR
jgi:phospho-N-acetylmuramoyl-pentapeptide-transferase